MRLGNLAIGTTKLRKRKWTLGMTAIDIANFKYVLGKWKDRWVG
jgi:hypothetical protein